jgi:methionyl aminopeptidase
LITDQEKILKEGDVVSLDLGLTHRGLITDSAITVLVGGKGNSEDKNLIEHTKEALYLGIKEAVAGKRIGDIGFTIGSFGRKFGYGICEGLAGHGVGYKVHEDPYVPNDGIPGTGEVLKPGMVIAIEPMFTLGSSKIVLAKDGYTYKTKDGSKAAHFEHTIVITDDKPLILTK